MRVREPAVETKTRTDADRTRRAVVILLIGTVAIGLAPVLVRWSQVGLSATAAWRLLLSAPLFAMAMCRQRGQTPRCGGQAGPPARAFSLRDGLVLAVPGLLFSGDLGFWHQSLGLTSVANATLFTNCAPVFVALAGWLWLKERLGWTYVQGLLLAVGGACLMSLFRPRVDGVDHSLLGDAMGVVSAAFYGGYQLAIKRLRQRFSTATIMTFTAVVSGAVLAAVACISGETLLPGSLAGWAVLVALAVVVQIGGQGLIVHAMRHLPASFASVSLLFQVVVATATGWLLLANEAVGLWQAMGGVLILLGIYLARKGSAPRISTTT